MVLRFFFTIFTVIMLSIALVNFIVAINLNEESARNYAIGATVIVSI